MSKASRNYWPLARLFALRKRWSSHDTKYTRQITRHSAYARWLGIQYKPSEKAMLQPSDYLWSHQPIIRAYGGLYAIRKSWKVANTKTIPMRWKL